MSVIGLKCPGVKISPALIIALFFNGWLLALVERYSVSLRPPLRLHHPPKTRCRISVLHYKTGGVAGTSSQQINNSDCLMMADSVWLNGGI